MHSIKTKLINSKELDSKDNQTSPAQKRKRTTSSYQIAGAPDKSVFTDIQPAPLQKAPEPAPVKLEQYPIKIYNKLEDNYHLSNKKALFLNMRFFYEAFGADPFDALPMTFHVKSGLQDPEFVKFKQYYDAGAGEKNNIWIIKPGENTNRGQGISVSKDYPEIKALVEESTRSKKRTCIV